MASANKRDNRESVLDGIVPLDLPSVGTDGEAVNNTNAPPPLSDEPLSGGGEIACEFERLSIEDDDEPREGDCDGTRNREPEPLDLSLHGYEQRATPPPLQSQPPTELCFRGSIEPLDLRWGGYYSTAAEAVSELCSAIITEPPDRGFAAASNLMGHTVEVGEPYAWHNEPQQPPEQQPEQTNLHRGDATDVGNGGSTGGLGRRRNYCVYCDKMVTNYARHLVARHPGEDDVKKYIALGNEPPAERRRKRGDVLRRIKNASNMQYNNQIIEGERSHGTLLPVKRPSHNRRLVTNTTHVTCNRCSGLYRRQTFFKHLVRCKRSEQQQDGQDGRSPLVVMGRVLQNHAALLAKVDENASDMLREEVFPRMQKDIETVTVQNDPLICRYGSNFRFTHRGTSDIRYCSSRMRSLARLLITMKERSPDIQTLRDCIAPKRFDTLVESVRQMSKFNSTEGSVTAPSVAPRLCSSLKKCANIVKSDTIKDVSLTKEERRAVMFEMNDFLHLMDKDWCTEVGSNSDKSQKRQRVMKADLLPDPDDIRTFSSYIHGLRTRYVRWLKGVPNIRNYVQLAKLIIAHIISFNRRRPNETVHITLQEYRSTLNKTDDYDREAQHLLTEEQKMSGKRLSIFYVAASKNLMKVPILLTKPFHRALDVLIAYRKMFGIRSKFLFVRPDTGQVFDGSAVLKEFANRAGLKSPSTFTANALRHHAATSSQLQTRNDTYTKSLSKFMGHDLRTHEYFYEMPLPVVQKSIVGHELLRMTMPRRDDEGVSSQDAVAAPPSHTIVSAEIHEEEDESAVATPTPASPPPSPPTFAEHIASCADATMESDSGDEAEADCTGDDGGGSSKRITRRRSEEPQPSTSFAATPIVTDTNDDEDEDPDYEENIVVDDYTDQSSGGTTPPDTPPPRKKHKKQRWTAEEMKPVFERFGYQFMLSMRPRRQEIREFWQHEPALQNRSLQQIVTYVNNISTGKQRIVTPMRRKIKRMVKGGKETFSP